MQRKLNKNPINNNEKKKPKIYLNNIYFQEIRNKQK